MNKMMILLPVLMIALSSCSGDVQTDTYVEEYSYEEITPISAEDDISKLDEALLSKNDVSVYQNIDNEVEFHSNVLSYSSLSEEAIEKAVNISEFIIPVFIASVEELEKLRAYSAADLEHLEKVKDAALKFNNLIKFRVEAHGFEENKNKLQELGVDLNFNSLGAEVFGELNSRDAFKDGQVVMADDSKLMEIYEILSNEYARMNDINKRFDEDVKSSSYYKDYISYFKSVERSLSSISSLIKPEFREVVDSLNSLRENGIFLKQSNAEKEFRSFTFTEKVMLDKRGVLTTAEKEKITSVYRLADSLIKKFEKINSDIESMILNGDDSSYSGAHIGNFLKQKVNSARAVLYFSGYRLVYDEVIKLEKKLADELDIKFSFNDSQRAVKIEYFESKVSSKEALMMVKDYIYKLDNTLIFRNEFNPNNRYQGAYLPYIVYRQSQSDLSVIKSKMELSKKLINNEIRPYVCESEKIESKNSFKHINQLAMELREVQAQELQMNDPFGQNSYVNPITSQSLEKFLMKAKEDYKKQLSDEKSVCDEGSFTAY